MSVTEWVIDAYTKDIDSEVNLESAKNFTFVWVIFENMAKKRIFSEEALKFEEFFNWVNTLEIVGVPNAMSITDSVTGNKIEDHLIKGIHASFNHFYQKYLNDSSAFTNLLYNQDIPQVLKEKKRFTEFMETIDRFKIQDKISFLFFITKRIRNKFLHGIKSISQVSKDHKEFEKASKYLIAIISLIEKYD